MGNEVNGKVLSASDLKGSEDNKDLDEGIDKGANGTGGDDKSKDDNVDLSYREKPKYVSLEKHRKILKQRNEARKALKEKNESTELENLGIDSAVAEKMADKLGLDAEATKEFADLIFKSGVQAATKIVEAKYGKKIKQVSTIAKNEELTKRFNEDFTNNLISVLDNDADKKLARENKEELKKLAFLEENLKSSLYALYVKHIKGNNPKDTDPPEVGKVGGGKPNESKKLEEMSKEEQRALSDEEWEKLDAERIARQKG